MKKFVYGICFLSVLFLLGIAIRTVMAGPPCANVKSQFLIDSQTEWQKAIAPGGKIRPMFPHEWPMYANSLQQNFKEGEPYPTDTSFIPAQLSVYGGGGGGGLDPNDAGMVMLLLLQSLPPGNYASAFVYEYGEDPSLVNSTITITVTPPQFGPTGQVNTVSFGIVDGAGWICSWWWNCPAPIPWVPPGAPTTITINTAGVLGVASANPVATGFAIAPGFNLANSISFIVDENFRWIGGPQPVPLPGGAPVWGLWNYWHNFFVTNNTPPLPVEPNVSSKFYVKWSQRPVPIDPNAKPLIFRAWNERSDYNNGPILADDWQCRDDRPVTDIHWWGSFIGWTQPYPPPVLPRAFHIGIWTDDPCNFPGDFSHPAHLVWENYCTSWVWNFAGYDHDPRSNPDPCNPLCQKETDFQFNQLLSQCEWFYQEPNGPNDLDGDPNTAIYWLSIAAVYDANDYTDPNFYPWGWKTRPHFFQDDAVRIRGTQNSVTGLIWPPTPPTVCSWWLAGEPVFYPTWEDTWDLSFELSTNEPAYRDAPIPGDLDLDKMVDLKDFAIFADFWLASAIGPGPFVP